MEIPSNQILFLIQQFLRESNLNESLECLQKESKSVLNTLMDSKLEKYIRAGDWKHVLEELSTLALAPALLIELYQEIALDFIEDKELEGARIILRQTEPMQMLRDREPERYIGLEGRLTSTRNLTRSSEEKSKSRERIAKGSSYRIFTRLGLKESVGMVAPNRLVSLLGQALKWQVSQKMAFLR